MTNLQKLIVIGAGGFGPEIVWAAENMNGRFPTFDILGFCDDDAEKKGRNLYGYRVLGTPEEVDRNWEVKPGFVCAIGNNHEARHGCGESDEIRLAIRYRGRSIGSGCKNSANRTWNLCRRRLGAFAPSTIGRPCDYQSLLFDWA